MVIVNLHAFGEFVRTHRPALEVRAAKLCAGSTIDATELVGETLERALSVFERLQDQDTTAATQWLDGAMSRCFSRMGGQLPEAKPATPDLQQTFDMLRARFREVYGQPVFGKRAGATAWRM
ncbi:hypothetical protein G4177_09400 [Corallococcus sp. ZKHCc1 1396]|uniref:Sigma-70 family RNA polymerase sigma factor n=1 Tax=Corallococcus soli TaxID=2710757 RepID=A0ABR9PKC4_9BACT|nr:MULTISPECIES: hypothetical protein [Corallococcus]MBE4748382.1 hypothetical protein [Corallococcus soli]MCY1034832.1 hypothetical protein [Corallococcus sp. BB11-1]